MRQCASLCAVDGSPLAVQARCFLSSSASKMCCAAGEHRTARAPDAHRVAARARATRRRPGARTAGRNPRAARAGTALEAAPPALGKLRPPRPGRRLR
jgi:hypothetical protein